MKRFIYRYAFLCELLASLPVIFLCSYLNLKGYIGGGIYFLAWAWCMLVIWFVGQRIPSLLHREALRKLDVDCDPAGFLQDIEFLLRRAGSARGFGGRRRFLLEMDHASGMDALGRYGEALAEIERLERNAPMLDPGTDILFHINIATIALHVPRKREEIPVRIREIENAIVVANFPPQAADIFRAHLEVLRDSYRFVCGEYHGLRERYVAAVEHARQGNSRRQLVYACMRLARLYDKLERPDEATALYSFVVQNGNRLGIVQEASERREILLSAKNTPPVCCENAESAEEAPADTN